MGLVVGALAAGLVACGPADGEWATEAEVYADALNDAYAAGPTNVAQFFTEDAIVDWRSIADYQGTGRGGVAQALREDRGAIPLEVDEPVYLSREGAVRPVWDPETATELHTAPVFFVSPQGVAEEIWAGSARSGEAYVGLPQADMEAIAQRYLDAWAGRDGATVEALYTGEAVLRDSLAGLELSGRAQIADAVESPPEEGGLPGATLRVIPEQGGPAIYINGPWSHRPDEVDRMVLLLDVTGDGDCPGQVGVALWLDAGQRITREERFHRVDAWRRCADDGQLPTGWWDEVRIPDPRAFTRTGQIGVGQRVIELWNGTPQREQLVRWGLRQFTDAGLVPPALTSVTFVPFDGDPWATYGFLPGGADLIMPATAEACPQQGCDLWPADQRAAALTGLARRWLVESAPRGAMAQFAGAHDLAWTEAADPESDPALTRAAATLAWGLMDEPYPGPQSVASLSCAELVEDFGTLTLAHTAGKACAAPGG